MQAVFNKLRFFRFLVDHPLNRGRSFRALAHYLRWQVSSRLALGPVAVNFVDNTRLLVVPGMTGATGNIYTGLHEFEDMAFVLHLLRPGDLFVDVGANIGSYTVLAAGAAGARGVAVEPLPGTFSHLNDNIRLNGLSGTVRALNIGIGMARGTLGFTTGLDTVNHVATASDAGLPTAQVPVAPLDDVLAGETAPMLIKIDVEGFEFNVIRGAHRVLSAPHVMGVILELNGSGQRYGFDEAAIHATLLERGFGAYRYLPFSRELVALDGPNRHAGNTLYVRHFSDVAARLAGSKRFHVCHVGQYV